MVKRASLESVVEDVFSLRYASDFCDNGYVMSYVKEHLSADIVEREFTSQHCPRDYTRTGVLVAFIPMRRRFYGEVEQVRWCFDASIPLAKDYNEACERLVKGISTSKRVWVVQASAAGLCGAGLATFNPFLLLGGGGLALGGLAYGLASWKRNRVSRLDPQVREYLTDVAEYYARSGRLASDFKEGKKRGGHTFRSDYEGVLERMISWVVEDFRDAKKSDDISGIARYAHLRDSLSKEYNAVKRFNQAYSKLIKVISGKRAQVPRSHPSVRLLSLARESQVREGLIAGFKRHLWDVYCEFVPAFRRFDAVDLLDKDGYDGWLDPKDV